MALRTPTRRARRAPQFRFGSLACLLLLAALVAGCAHDYPQSALSPKGDFAALVDGLFDTVMFWAVVVFVLVEGALLYVIFRYRGKPGDAEPEQVHGNTTLEIVWTVIPALVLAMIAVPTVRAIFKTNEIPAGNPLTVEVIGHQWWWEFYYPEYGIRTANEMHVPVGRTVSLRMNSTDVLHSFWVPQFAGKRDVFPKRETRIWFTAQVAGFWPGQCAEFCGIQHGKMAFHTVSQDSTTFLAWVDSMRATGSLTFDGKPAQQTTRQGATLAAAQQQPQTAAPQQPQTAAQDTARSAEMNPRDSSTAQVLDTTAAARGADAQALTQGLATFTKRGCQACHSVSAVNAPKGQIGPNLARVGARKYIAAGTLLNTDEHLARWIRDPQSFKEGVAMPNLGVTEDEARQLVAYFRALAK
jgi:cytochrome c oxidase subunit II